MDEEISALMNKTGLKDIINFLGKEEMLNQLEEECAELIQAASKVKRAKKGLTPVAEENAIEMLAEEIADVQLLIFMVAYAEKISDDKLTEIIGKKAVRWHERLLGDD